MELAAEKEKEARQLRSCYVEQLQQQAALSQAAVRREQLLRQQLQTDFEYNLRLVEERDRELVEYEAAIRELREAVNQLTAENSELKVMVAEGESAVSREREYHGEKMASLQTQLDQWQCAHREEVEGERKSAREVRRELEERLREVEGETERVRLEVTAHYENEAHRRDQQHRTRVDQLEDRVMLSQSEVKTRERELEQMKQCLLSMQEEAQGLRDRAGELERQLKAQEWAWQDRLTVTETELGRVQGELEHNITNLTSSQSHLQHKCSELDRLVREKSLCLQMAKEGWAEREAELECRVREMEAERLHLENERKTERDKLGQQLQEKSTAIDRMQREIAESREKERQLSDTTTEQLRMREEVNSLQTTLNAVTTDLHKAEQRCQTSGERIEREWREKMRETERRASARSQAALKTLAMDRDKIASEVRALKDKLSWQQKILDEVTKERDVAIATLNTPTSECHGMLSQQNQQLRSVIAAMRQELEQLSDGSNHGYTSYLESELVRVKSENRQLRAAGEEKPATSKPPARSLLALTEALAMLQREKTALEMRVVWLQQQLDTVQSQLRERKEEVYQLRAVQVAPLRCQQKLLLATQSIISLLREREALTASLGTRDHPPHPHLPPASHPHPQPASHPHPQPASHPHPQPASHPHPQPASHPHPAPSSHPHPQPASHPHSAPSSHPAPSPHLLPPSHYTPSHFLQKQEPSLSSLHFSDSEVEGQHSLEKLLQVHIISTHPSPEHRTHPPQEHRTHSPPEHRTHPPPEHQTHPPQEHRTHPPPEHQTHPPQEHQTHPPPEHHGQLPLLQPTTAEGVVAMEMHGHHMKPSSRKPRMNRCRGPVT